MGLPNRDSHGRFVHGAGSAGTRVNDEVITRVKARLKERARKLAPHRLTIGIHEADGAHPKLDYDHKETDATVVQVAATHEFGGRSWLRSWFDRNRNRLVHEMNAVMKSEFKGDKDAIAKAGERWANELREWIEMEDAHLKRLKPSTVAAKERAGLDRPGTPLYATGELVAAIKAMMDGATL